MLVGAPVPHDPHRPHGGEHGEALPDLPGQAGPADLLGDDRIGVAQDLEPLGGHLADDADAQPRTGERLAPDDVLGQAELLAHGADLVLEEVPQRLDELERHVVGKAAHVVVRLDHRVVATPRLDDVGIEGALHQEAGPASPAAAEKS